MWSSILTGTIPISSPVEIRDTCKKLQANALRELFHNILLKL